jgi:serine/threonine-protein kinase
VLLAADVVCAQETPEDKVRDILARNCAECHRDSDEGGINYIMDLGKLLDKKKIVPRDLEASRVWVRINDSADPMPPEGNEPRPTNEDIAAIKVWIESLAPSGNKLVDQAIDSTLDSDPKRDTVTTSKLIGTIHGYLADRHKQDRRYKRFVVLNHLHNLPSKLESERIGVDANDLAYVRAAVSKAINSLTWSSSIVVPRPIDISQTVLVFDLRDVEWDANMRTGRPDLWNIVVQEYPYALRHDQYPDVESNKRLAAEIYDWTETTIPWVRADWLISTALQPHLYHSLLYDAVFSDLRRRQPREVVHADGATRLEQPMTAEDLLEKLGVDLIGNLQRNRAVRAGFTRSGVSSQPRMLERHPALYGSMWDSYDFKRGNVTMNLNGRPLGPDGIFDSNRFEEYSFRHDGGEYIFGLPNGLHGYLLALADGDRIPFGPPDIVEDRKKTLGNAIIVNSLSCVACHQQGLITDFRDEVRFGIAGLPSEARRLVRNLFLDRPDFDELINRDQQRYRSAAIEAMNPFWDQATVNRIKSGGELIEPIGPVARRFMVDTIDLETMAIELEVEIERLKNAIEFNDSLRRLGLTSVANGGTINREIWQQGEGLSTFQRAAQALKIGTPTSVQAIPWRGR